MTKSIARRGAGTARSSHRSGREDAASSRPLPVVTAALCLAAVALFGLDAGGAWEWSRAAIERGEGVRLLTGHLTHWSLDHLAWDVGALAVLGAWLERRGRGRFVLLCLGAAAAISLGLLVFDPGLAAYRGLSGIDSALFVAACTSLLRDAFHERDLRGGAAAGLLLAGFVAKVGVELATGASLFVSEIGAVEVTPLAHAIGCAVALASTATSSPTGQRRDGRQCEQRSRGPGNMIRRAA